MLLIFYIHGKLSRIKRVLKHCPHTLPSELRDQVIEEAKVTLRYIRDGAVQNCRKVFKKMLILTDTIWWGTIFFKLTFRIITPPQTCVDCSAALSTKD